MSTSKFLISGFDTIECAYYLIGTDNYKLDFIELAAQKESMVRAKVTKPKPIQIGSEEFLIASYGTSSGYSFIIENDAFSIHFGEFNRPNFFVKFRSIALWHYGALALHNRFIAWAKSVGMMPYQPKRSSRVDYAFDYHLPVIDFDLDSFVTVAAKVNQLRKNRKVQTFNIGFDIIKLRVYDKVDEINKKKAKRHGSLNFGAWIKMSGVLNGKLEKSNYAS